MTIGPDELLTFQRLEFDKASRLRNGVICCQFMLALPTAASVLVADGTFLYFLAVAAVVLLLAWLVLDWRYRIHREAGERARKATLLTHGLGERLSASELLGLEAAFVTDAPRSGAALADGYFATDQAPGLERLTDMLEESAFWSSDLHRHSAIVMGTIFLVLIGSGVVAAVSTVPFTQAPTLMVIVRVVLAMLVFALSSDILGAVRGHWKAAAESAGLVVRLQKAAEAGYPKADVLFLAFEYNSAVEGAPVVMPLAYALRRLRLEALWQGYRLTRPGPTAPAVRSGPRGKAPAP